MGKKNRRRGSSKAGRPRKGGDRFSCGKLKPAVIGEVVIAKRKAGDAEAGEHPLDFALSNGWITEALHKTAMRYRATYNHAHIGGPRLSLGSLAEVTPSEDLRQNWSQLSDEEITGIWDKVFAIEAGPEDREQIEATALALWHKLNRALTSDEREEMFKVCVLGSWPFWMTRESSGMVLGRQDTDRKRHLFDGLGAVTRATRPQRPAATITPMPHRPSRKGKSELPIVYETQDGVQVVPTSDRGVPFEAVILRKRA
jgi:hypothetical protein